MVEQRVKGEGKLYWDVGEKILRVYRLSPLSLPLTPFKALGVANKSVHVAHLVQSPLPTRRERNLHQ